MHITGKSRRHNLIQTAYPRCFSKCFILHRGCNTVEPLRFYLFPNGVTQYRSSRHPPFTHYPFPLRSLVCGGQPSPHQPRLVVSHSTCPPLSSSPHAHSFVLGTAVINTHTFVLGPAVINTHTHVSYLQRSRAERRSASRIIDANCICIG
jgi:hypothetical protein